MAKVVIIGGGVAGMSAAHELIERGFEVEVYEKHSKYVGGKARSVDVPHTNLQYPDKFLPGEHGFRFFPGFYKHITDTMKRTPFIAANGKQQADGCYGNLTHTTRIMIARNGQSPIVTTANFPRTISDIKLLIKDLTGGANTGLTHEEEEFFATKVWQLMTTGSSRRHNEYESIGWWEFLEADKFSVTYQHLLVEGLTRTLVAAQARTASTKTGGDIFLQLVFNMTEPMVNTDRVLNGPTNDVWLNPWKDYLLSKGVKYFHHHNAKSVNLNNGVIESVSLHFNHTEHIIAKGDYYLFAVPVEQMAKLINADMLKEDACLSNLEQLASSTSWMNGMQFYLNEDVAINNGHIIFSDSEWAVTSISQIQFWKDYDLQNRFNGKIKGILSVDISDWLYIKYKGVLAEDCEPETVKNYVWEQIKIAVNVDGQTLLRDDMIEHWYLDRDIKWQVDQGKSVDKEPLLVNTVNSWTLRPEASTDIPNMFLAADYVRTNTDLATMEGANEAARRAVNCIIEASGSKADLAEVYPLTEPWFFKPLKWYDEQRYQKGLPYSAKQPWWLKLFMIPWGGAYLAVYFFQVLLSFILAPFNKILPNVSTRNKFAFSAMAFAIGALIYFSTYKGGWITASIWGYGMFAVYVLYWLITKDELFKRLIIFGFAAGVAELIADAYLVSVTNTLVYPFPEPMLWDSPAYMPFSWTIVLIQIGYIAWLIDGKLGPWKDGLLMIVFSGILIPLYENWAIHAGWWSYQNAKMIGDVPLYIYIAEGLLMFTVPFFLLRCMKRPVQYSVLYGLLQGIVMLLACIIAIFITTKI
jgi:uncharacterized protein with NAD-binding domain and iron-sulfur cluster